MKTVKYFFPQALAVMIILLTGGCAKTIPGANSLYTPTSANVTANATLQELQQGRILYINNCGACHALVSPDNYSPAQWKTVLAGMTPRTSLSASEIQLVTKYVCKGNQ